MRSKLAILVVLILIIGGSFTMPAIASDPLGTVAKFRPGDYCSTGLWRFNLYRMRPNKTWQYMGLDVLGGRDMCPRVKGIKF